jgi:hypothetical protein
MKKQVIEKEIQFDSDEEMYFYWWLEELRQAGYIKEIIRDVEPFDLSSRLSITYTVKTQLKTKIKEKEKDITILHPHIYTADFKVIWADKALHKLHEPIFVVGSNINILFYSNVVFPDPNGIVFSFFEVKPTYDQNNMTRLFTVNQKWVWDKFAVFINKVIPEKLFSDTFTPMRYLTTNKSGKLRKIKFKVRTLEEYLSLYDKS